MKTSPHRLAVTIAATLLLLLAFVATIFPQTTEEPALSRRAALDKTLRSPGQESYGTASGSERDKEVGFAFRQNESSNTQTFNVKQSGLLTPLASTTPTGMPAWGTPSARRSVNSDGIQKRDNEWGIWGGISFDSPTLIGKTPDARFGNVGLRYGRVLVASKTVAFEWTIDAIPLSILSNNRYVATSSPFVFTIQRKSVYGAGAAPIGLKFNFRRNRRLQPFGHATGGFLYFSEQVPAPGASQFNFTFDFSGGVQVVNNSCRSFTIGYKYQHISNGNTANFNPGVDVQMIVAGFSVFR